MPEYTNINHFLEEQIEDFIVDVVPDFDFEEARKNPMQYIKAWDKVADTDISDTDVFEDELNYRLDNMLTYYYVVQDIYFNSYYSQQIQEEDDMGIAIDTTGGYDTVISIMSAQIYSWGQNHFRERYQKFINDDDRFDIILSLLSVSSQQSQEDNVKNRKVEDALAKYYNEK
jgi:hypothetical protein